MTTVLVTAAGAPPGFTTCNILSEKYNIIATDADKYASGLYQYNVTPYVIPLCSKPDYIDRLISICKKEFVDMIFPALEIEAIVISKHRKRFDEIGVKYLLPPHEVLQSAADKYKTAMAANKAGIPCPKTVLLNDADEANNARPSFPSVLKPVQGSGARGVYYAKDRKEYDKLISKLDFEKGYLVQEMIIGGFGSVYLVALLYDKQSRLKASFLSRSLKAAYKEGGPCIVGTPVKDEKLKQMGIDLIEALGGFVGPAAIEFKVDEKTKTPKLLEINPRIWGYSRLAYGSGLNIHNMIVQLALDEDIPAQHDYALDRLFVRSYDDKVFKRSEIRHLKG